MAYTLYFFLTKIDVISIKDLDHSSGSSEGIFYIIKRLFVEYLPCNPRNDKL